VTSPNGHGPAKDLFDPHNVYRGELSTEWTTGKLQTPQGERGAVCFRMPNTTLTLVLAKDDLATLIGSLQTLHGQMNGLILPPSGG